MFQINWRRKLGSWGGWRSSIVVVVLEECHYIIGSLISSAQDICVRCRHVDEIIGIIILDIMPDLL